MKSNVSIFLKFPSALLFFFLFLNCKNESTYLVTKVVAQKTLVEKEQLVLEKKIKVDSIFDVKGKPFKVNGLQCYWEYRVHFDFKNPEKQNVIIKFQQLKNLRNQKTLFETTNKESNSDNLYTIKELQNYGAYNLDCSDVNTDGFCDYKIVTERAAAGANTTYDVFLFNAKKNVFEHSAIFSGTNVEYDAKKNRIFTMWKMGARTYIFSYKNLMKNKLDVESTETIAQEQDTITYTKTQNSKVVAQKKIVLKRFEGQGDEISAEDTQYLLDRK